MEPLIQTTFRDTSLQGALESVIHNSERVTFTMVFAKVKSSGNNDSLRSMECLPKKASGGGINRRDGGCVDISQSLRKVKMHEASELISM